MYDQTNHNVEPIFAPTEIRLAGTGPRLLTVQEACDQLRVGRWMLYHLIRTGQLQTIKIGSRRLVPVEAINTFIDAHRRRAGRA